MTNDLRSDIKKVLQRPDASTDALRALLERAIVEPVPEVGVYVEGGVVQAARASSPVAFFVVDIDELRECEGGTEGKCSRDESPFEHEYHISTRNKLHDYRKLAVGAF